MGQSHQGNRHGQGLEGGRERAGWPLAKRPPQAARDSDFALDYCRRNAQTIEQQQQALAALEFKCSVLWAMCDALQHAYVDPKEIPPGAFTPGG
jgi:pyrroloquinoline-quinone synthase